MYGIRKAMKECYHISLRQCDYGGAYAFSEVLFCRHDKIETCLAYCLARYESTATFLSYAILPAGRLEFWTGYLEAMNYMVKLLKVRLSYD